jgi:hypothetical protein
MATPAYLQTTQTQFKPSSSPSLLHQGGQLFGHVLNLLPGYSTLGSNITNPNVNYKGVTNPGVSTNAKKVNSDSGDGSGGGSGQLTGIYSGGSGGSSTANSALAAALDQQIGTYQNYLNDLPNQQRAQESILNGQFASSRAGLDTSHNRSLEDLTNQRNQVTQNRAHSLNDLASRGRNLIQALNNQLGTMGAGSSSASQVLAPYAIAQQQNRLGGDINHQAQDQFQAIDTEQNRVEQDYKTAIDSLEQDRLSKLLDVGSKFADLAHQYQLGMQTANAQKAEALNGAYSGAVQDVNNAVANIEAQYRNSLANIQNYYSNYNPTAPEIKAPTNNVENLNTAGFQGVGVDPAQQQQAVTAAFLGDNKDQNQPVLY